MQKTGAAAPRFYFPRRRLRLHRRQPVQMTLALPPMPKESPLRDAFRRSELARFGLDFKAVLGHWRGGSLLHRLAEAYGRCDDQAVRLYKGFLIRMRSEFSKGTRP